MLNVLGTLLKWVKAIAFQQRFHSHFNAPAVKMPNAAKTVSAVSNRSKVSPSAKIMAARRQAHPAAADASRAMLFTSCCNVALLTAIFAFLCFS
jgi:hypothetical protein